jgi:anti-sigma-K factor RskA
MVEEKHTQVLELLPAYALDSLDEPETVLVSEHLADCHTCWTELQAFKVVVEQLPLALPEVSPPPELQQRLLARIQTLASPGGSQSSPARLRQKPGWFGPISYGQLALLGLIVVLLASNLFLWMRLNRLELAGGSNRMQAIRLVSTGRIPEANGFILISADGLSGAIVVDELPRLGEDQEYQLWLEQAGESASGAVFSVDELGYGGARVSPPQPLFNYTGASITVEPAGGSAYPTGESLLAASLFSP